MTKDEHGKVAVIKGDVMVALRIIFASIAVTVFFLADFHDAAWLLLALFAAMEIPLQIRYLAICVRETPTMYVVNNAQSTEL